MTVERENSVTLLGQSFTLVGSELRVGDDAPEFEVVGSDLKPVRLADTSGKLRIFSVVPSLDTPVCDAQTRRFNSEASSLTEVGIYNISMDLPFAQTRWCDATGVSNVTMLSDHRDASFGRAYGTLVKELRLESRALFVVGADDKVLHVEYVGEIANHPDYDAALKAIKDSLG